jgi:hypothetical protein
MAIYSAGISSTNTTTGANVDFRAGAANSPKFLELGIILGTSTNSTFYIGRSANTPAQSGPTQLLAEDVNNPLPLGQTTYALAWTVAPTAPTAIFRRAYINGSVAGCSNIFSFPRGVSIQPASSTMVVWNAFTNSNPTFIWGVVDE